MVNWTGLTIPPQEADFKRLLNQWWSWSIKKPYKPLYMTLFGDWILEDENGKIDILDVVEGDIKAIAVSREEFDKVMAEEANLEKWFSNSFVTALKSKGIARAPGQCFGYKIHPAIGGAFEAANLTPLYIKVWQAISGQIHRQLRQAPEGTRFCRLEKGEGLEIRLVTERDNVMDPAKDAVT